MTTYELPDQPDGPLWDRDGDKWVRPNGGEDAFAVEDSWLRQVKGKNSLCVIWVDLLDEYGPLTDTPPLKVGDTVTVEEAENLPPGSIVAQKGCYPVVRLRCGDWRGLTDGVQWNDSPYTILRIGWGDEA